MSHFNKIEKSFSFLSKNIKNKNEHTGNTGTMGLRKVQQMGKKILQYAEKKDSPLANKSLAIFKATIKRDQKINNTPKDITQRYILDKKQISKESKLGLLNIYSEKENTVKKFLEFQSFFEKYPNCISQDKENTCKLFLEMAQKGYELENHVDMLIQDKKLNETLDKLNEIPVTPDTKNIIQDLLLTCTFIPNKWENKGKERYEIQPITINTLNKRLNEILSNNGNAELCERLKHLTSKEHPQNNIWQKIALISLNSTRSDIREGILNDPHFREMLIKDNLAEWMLSTSGSMRQEYLNTCEGCSFIQDVLNKTSGWSQLDAISQMITHDLEQKLNGQFYQNPQTTKSISDHYGADPEKEDFKALLITLARNTQNTVAQKAFNKNNTTANTNEEVIKRRLQKSHRDYNLINQKLKKAFNKDKLDFQEIRKLKLEWNKATQRLLSINLNDTSTQEIIALNAKIIKENWWASALLNAAWQGISQFLPHSFLKSINIEDIPVESRMEGISDRMTQQLKKEWIDFNSQYKSLNENENNPSFLWEQLAKSGGASFERQITGIGPHAMYIKAVTKNGEKAFLINDPMFSGYKTKNNEQMQKYLNKPGLRFALEKS